MLTDAAIDSAAYTEKISYSIVGIMPDGDLLFQVEGYIDLNYVVLTQHFDARPVCKNSNITENNFEYQCEECEFFWEENLT